MIFSKSNEWNFFRFWFWPKDNSFYRFCWIKSLHLFFKKWSIEGFLLREPFSL